MEEFHIFTSLYILQLHEHASGNSFGRFCLVQPFLQLPVWIVQASIPNILLALLLGDPNSLRTNIADHIKPLHQVSKPPSKGRESAKKKNSPNPSPPSPPRHNPPQSENASEPPTPPSRD